MKTFNLQKGFSLIEMMVAMVAALVVVGAVSVFTVATARSSSTNVRSMRLMQNLRNSMSLIEREIRRSGYNQKALSFAGQCVSTSGTCPVGNFNELAVVSANCLVVAYDNSANATAGVVDAGEFHGFRLETKNGVGVIQASLSGASAPDCSAAANSTAWLDVSDPTVVDVTGLTFTDVSDSGGCVQQKTTGMWIVVQDIRVQMSGRWVEAGGGQLTTTRGLDETVRVKNDFISTTKPGVCS
jgi:prepilin-type N-terminal cleavage/methylation domain-containing protein